MIQIEKAGLATMLVIIFIVLVDMSDPLVSLGYRLAFFAGLVLYVLINERKKPK